MWYLRESDGTLTSTGEADKEQAHESAAELAELAGIESYDLVWLA